MSPGRQSNTSVLSGGSPFRLSSPSPRKRDPVYIAPLPRDSRLVEPTVATVMRSLDTAQQSPVIKRLQRDLAEQTSKTYLFRGPKFAKNLASFQAADAKKKRKVKKRRGSRTKAVQQ
jgi:hypothetical protein